MPDRNRSIARASGRVEQGVVDALVLEEIEADEDRAGGARGAARSCLVPTGGQRIVEVLRANPHLQSSPLKRNPTLELLQRHVDSGVVEPLECDVETLLAEERGDVAGGDPGPLEEPSVGASRILEHPLLQETGERSLPRRQLPLETATGICKLGGLPEERPQACEEASGRP